MALKDETYTVIKQIKLADGNHELNAKYWNGHEWSELAHAITFIGAGETTKPAAGNYVQASVSVKGTAKTYYISVTDSGTATEVAAVKGNVFVITENAKEFICTTGGLHAASVWEELGDESSYQLIGKTLTTSDSSAASTGSAGGATVTSGSGGAQTATGTASITYKKSDAATGSAGAGLANQDTGAGGGVTIDFSNATFTGSPATIEGTVSGISIDDHTYTPAGSISSAAPGSGETANYTPAGTISAVSASDHTHSLSVHKHNTDVTAVSGYPDFSGGSLTGDKTFVKTAIKSADLDVKSSETTGYQKVITDVTDPTLGGTTTFNTDAVKNPRLDVQDSEATGYQAVVTAISGGSVSGEFLTGIKTAGSASLGGGKYGFAAITGDNGVTNVMYKPEVSNLGVLSWSEITPSAATISHTDPEFNKDSPSYTAPTITTKYLKVLADNASTASVTLSGGVHTAKWIDVATEACGTSEKGTVGFTAASLGTASTVSAAGALNGTESLTSGGAGAFSVTPTFTGTGRLFKFAGEEATLEHSVTGTGSISATYTPEGTISGSQVVADHTHKYTAPSAHTHTIGLTDTEVSGTASVAVSDHTHSVVISDHTHSMGHTHTVTTSNS